MHEPMEEEGTIVEEEGAGGDVNTGVAMHEAMEEGGTMVEEEGVGGDVDSGVDMHEPMEEGGTLVEEEATPVVDPMINATSGDVWPCYKPST
jgi:hypothetical protein